MIDPGKLDRQIVIQNYTTSTDVMGQPVKTWADFFTCWAKLEQYTGEEEVSEQVVAFDKVKFTVRWDTTYTENVTAKMRVKWNSKYYYIESVRWLGREEYVELLTELQDGGR